MEYVGRFVFHNNRKNVGSILGRCLNHLRPSGFYACWLQAARTRHKLKSPFQRTGARPSDDRPDDSLTRAPRARLLEGHPSRTLSWFYASAGIASHHSRAQTEPTPRDGRLLWRENTGAQYTFQWISVVLSALDTMGLRIEDS